VYTWSKTLVPLLMVAAAGCATPSADPSSDANHPANPSAAQTPYQPPADLSATEAPAEAPSAQQAYVCPMHPQVVQNEPGTCPICHMNLVPQAEQPAGEQGGGGHEHH
jgi:hypothetical protein